MAPRTSYGSITVKHDDDEELARLVEQNGGESKASSGSSKKKFVMVGVVVVAAVALVLVFGANHHGSGNSSASHSGKGGSHPFHGDDSNVLSSKSPVDMGFLSIEREQDASPSKIWGNRTGPLPTNSWYLVSYLC